MASEGTEIIWNSAQTINDLTASYSTNAQVTYTAQLNTSNGHLMVTPHLSQVLPSSIQVSFIPSYSQNGGAVTQLEASWTTIPGGSVDGPTVDCGNTANLVTGTFSMVLTPYWTRPSAVEGTLVTQNSQSFTLTKP
jgi:hypothetical protein